MPDELTFAVVGATIPNKGKRGKPGPNQEFEILVSQPGETVYLRPEPDNRADQNAIAIYSARGIQIGYIAADRTILIRRAWGEAREVRAIFQSATARGALIRVNLDGKVPTLPLPPEPQIKPDDGGWSDVGGDNQGFWPDEEWPDE